MRQFQLKPKIQKRVLIAPDLQRFFQYTHTLIENKDSAAVFPSDDLIQNDERCAYGGLMEQGSDLYAFTYFPISQLRPRWDIEATAREIADFASGTNRRLDLWGCTSLECGNLFMQSDGVCFYCDYVDDERDVRDRIIPTLVESVNKKEWVQSYLRHFPDDHPMLIIGNFNSHSNPGERLGWFTLDEMEQIVAEFRQSASQQLSLEIE